jgi:thiamine-monophosphate kinase
MQRACDDFGCTLLGGDTGGYSTPVLSAAAVGYCPKNKALLRRNAKPGDVLMLSGCTGIGGAARAYFSARMGGTGLRSADEDRLLEGWRRPVPQLAQGQGIVREGLASCAIDSSDGLKAAIQQLAAASRLRAVVDVASLPVDPAVSAVADLARIDAINLVLSDSPDFRLVFAVAARDEPRVHRFFDAHGWPVWSIGAFVVPDDVSLVGTAVSRDGAELPGIPWDHSETPTLDRLRER